MKSLLFLFCFYSFYNCGHSVSSDIPCQKLAQVSQHSKCLQESAVSENKGDQNSSPSNALIESVEARLPQILNEKLLYTHPSPEHNILMLVFYSIIFFFSFFGNVIMIMVMYFGMRSSFLDVSIYLVNLGKSSYLLFLKIFLT